MTNQTRRCSPMRDDLMVQQQVESLWQHFVGVICLNQTYRKQVKEVLPKLFKRYPTPEKFLKGRTETQQRMLQPLGMWRRRTNMLRRMSEDYLTWDGKDATMLYGIGEYGSDSYRIFYKGERFEPKDKELRKYLGY